MARSALADALPLTPKKADALVDTARQSTHHLGERDPQYFYEKLPAREHWRLFADFRDDTAYFDIETTGLGGPDDYITTIIVCAPMILVDFSFKCEMPHYKNDDRS